MPFGVGGFCRIPARRSLGWVASASFIERTIRLLHSFIPTKKGTANAVPFGGTESRKNAHRIISDKQNGILLPSGIAAIRLSAIRQTISRKPGLMPCRRLAPHKRLSLRLYRSALTAVSLVPYSAANRHICFCFRR